MPPPAIAFRSSAIPPKLPTKEILPEREMFFAKRLIELKDELERPASFKGSLGGSTKMKRISCLAQSFLTDRRQSTGDKMRQMRQSEYQRLLLILITVGGASLLISMSYEP